MFYLIWVLVGLPAVFSHNLLYSRPGRAIRSLRGGSTLLASVGVDAFGCGSSLFLIAALFAGLAGWLYAHTNRFVSPSPFDVRASIDYLLMAVAGGLGHLSGALVGSALVLALRNSLQDVLPMFTQRGAQARRAGLCTAFHPAAASGARRRSWASSGVGGGAAPDRGARIRATFAGVEPLAATDPAGARRRSCCRSRAPSSASAGWSR